MAIAYLAGPISGTTDWAERFAAAEKAVRRAGWEVINPAQLEGEDEFLPLSWYMRRDLPWLWVCQAIVLLPGWERSRGARIELTLAIALGLDLYELSRGRLRPLSHEAAIDVLRVGGPPERIV